MDGTIAVLVRYGYLVVFGSVLAEQIGIPIPAIPFLLAAGAAAGTGQLSFALLLLLSGIASLIADMKPALAAEGERVKALQRVIHGRQPDTKLVIFNSVDAQFCGA